MIKGLYEAHLPVSHLERSIEFYKKLDLELAYSKEKLAFFWIEKGRSWLGLWETDWVGTPYHPSLRHVAFRVELEEMERVKEWLADKGIAVKPDFGFAEDRQPLVLPNPPHAHAAIYFLDPDGNSLEFMAPLQLDGAEEFEMMALAEWNQRK